MYGEYSPKKEEQNRDTENLGEDLTVFINGGYPNQLG